MHRLLILVFAAFLTVLSPSSSAAGVGLKSIEISDPSRIDPVVAKERRSWRLDIYFPAAGSRQAKSAYAGDASLVDAMIKNGYYDLPADTLRSWQSATGPAIENARPLRPTHRYPLVIIVPGSGVAAFNYSRLAAAIVEKGYAVAVVDLPYVGISRLSNGRLLRAEDFAGLNAEDPAEWRPAVRQWSKDISLSIDRLLKAPSPIHIDPKRIVVTGHSTGGIVALQLCVDDPRPIGCGDFEGAPHASDFSEEGALRPVFVTGSRSAKPDRPFTRPDLTNPFWSYLTKSRAPAWAVAITRATHMSYSDAPFVMPASLTQFGGELMNAPESMQLLTGIVVAFAKAYAPGGRGNADFSTYLAKQPNVLAVPNRL